MYTLLNNILKLVTPKILLFIGILLYLALFYNITLHKGYYYGTIVAFMPFIAIGIYTLLKHPLWSFIFLFISNYFIMGAMRYTYFQAGLIMDATIFFCLATLLLKTTYEKVEWKRSINILTLLTFLWLLFCIFELLNPRAVPFEDWASKVRGMAVYPFLMSILVSVLL